MALAVVVMAPGLAAGGEPEAERVQVPLAPEAEPFELWQADWDTGVLWRASNSTNLDYVVLPQVFTLRGPYHLQTSCFGYDLVVRPRFNLLAEAFVRGPESYYLGFSASPSLEAWNPERTRVHFLSVGGGFGWVDSTDVPGGQGQDFTLNWFIHAGTRFQVTDSCRFSLGVFYQHLSNGGATDPNPGLDAVGPMAGFSWKF